MARRAGGYSAVIALALIFAGCGATAHAEHRQTPATTATVTATATTPPLWANAAPAPACGNDLSPGGADSGGILLPATAIPTFVNDHNNHAQYAVSSCAADVARFFRNQLPQVGWTLAKAQQQDAQQYEFTFQRTGSSLEVMIIGYPDDDPGCYLSLTFA